jgi:succinate-acetate transporter protein
MEMSSTEPAPQGVLVGAGGDPLFLGLGVFCLGATALGLALIGVVPLSALGVVIPLIALATGLYQMVATIWGILLGQTAVAGILGMFSGFWLSLAGLLLGLQRGWYGIPAAEVGHAEGLYFISFAILFFFLLIVSLRLPLIYPVIVGIAVVALVVATIGAEGGSTGALNIAGVLILVFGALGFYAFLSSGFVALGGKALPLGRPIIR